MGVAAMLRMAQEALTFDDVLLVPGFSDVLPKDVSLKTRLTRNLFLNIPLLSAAMDTVTEARLAIAMAQEGGIGIIHKNMTMAQQAAEVRKVKKHESVIVKDPVTVSPKAKLEDLLAMARENGFSGFPVVEGETLVGIVTERDMRFQPNVGDSVADIMTPRERLVTVKEGTDLETSKAKMREHRIEKMLIVDDEFHLRGLVTFQDIEKARTYPMAAKDSDGRLLVGAAVGTGPETPDRVAALAEAGVDVIIVDTAHGHSQGVIDRVRWIKQNFPAIQVIVGNIATAEAAFEPGDAGDVPENGAVGPVGAARDNGNQFEAEGRQFLKAGLIFKYIDGIEFHAIGDQEFLGLEATGTPRLPIHFQRDFGVSLDIGFIHHVHLCSVWRKLCTRFLILARGRVNPRMHRGWYDQ